MPEPRRPYPDDDLQAALPPAPPPRPHAREEAIRAAMRRFDGVGERARPPQRPPARGWARFDRPRLGALVAAALVVSVGVPIWRAGDYGRPVPAEERPAEVRTAAVGKPEKAVAAADVASAISPPIAQRTPTLPPAAPSPTDPSDARVAFASQRSAPVSAGPTVPPPPPAMIAMPPPPPPPTAPAPAPRAAAEASDMGNIVVAGSRIGRGRAEVAALQARAQDRTPEAEADPTACTVADQARDADACRTVIAAAVTGRTRQAARDGVLLAWRGELESAIAAFDRVIRSNPRSAFAFYNRSLLHRRLGDVVRARADRARAIALDSRYRDAPK